MLETIRNHRRWMLFFVLVLILPSFVFFGIQGYNQMIEGDRAVARVAGQSITQPEVDEAQRRFFEQMRRQYGESIDPKMLDTPEARAAVIERLMSEKALQAEIKHDHVAYSDEQLGHFYSSTPEFLENGSFSAEKKAQIAASLGLTGVGLDQMVRREQSFLLLRSGVSETGIIPVAMRDRLLILMEDVREVRELRFDPAAYLSQAKVTEDPIKAYYDAHPKEFESPESVVAEYVTLSVDALASQSPMDEAELRRQHETAFGANLKKREEVRSKATALLAEVRKDPKRFAELAKQNSEDPGSAAQGGILPPFGRGEMVKPFEEAAFGLRKGELAPKLVETEFGFHILMLDDIKKGDKGEQRVARHILLSAPDAKRFEDVRAELEKTARAQEAQKRFTEASETFSNTVYEQSDSLEPVAEKLKLQIKRAENVTRGMPIQVLPEKLVEALFSDEALKAKRNTQAVEVQPGKLMAARVVSHQPAALQPFDTVRAQIKSKLERDEALRLTQQAADKKLEELKKAGAPSNFAGFSPARKVSRIKPEGLSSAALKVIMAPLPSGLPTYVLSKSEGDAIAIYAVLSSVRPDVPDPGRIVTTGHGLAQQAGAADDMAYMASLRTRYKAKVLKPEYRRDALKTSAPPQ